MPFMVYEFFVNLILFEPPEVDAQGRAVLTDHRARHIREVLGALAGTSIRAGLIDGPRGRAMITESNPDQVVLQCSWDEPMTPLPRVDLLLALPRPKVMRRLWAQLAAMGVGQIILTNANNVERVYFDTHVLQPKMYRPLLIEGLQQAQDTRLPKVSIHKRFKVLVEDRLDTLFPAGGRLLADPGGGERVNELISLDRDDRALLAVGPEGGWTNYEKDLLQRHGFRTVSMGNRTLRADTACVAMLALTNEALLL
jgi:16S rRNA (uracil1498-N3)-methyltransferase